MQGEQPSPDLDPRPLPPLEPALEECCKGGCEPRIFDRYCEALDRYDASLHDWLKRHPGKAREASGD